MFEKIKLFLKQQMNKKEQVEVGEPVTIERLQNIIASLESALDEKSRQMEAVAFHAVTTVANFIDAKEEYNQGHSTRVAKYSQEIARELGWSAEEVRNLHYVALLHDIGKPLCYTEDELGGHFKGHAPAGVELTREILSRLRFDKVSILAHL